MGRGRADPGGALSVSSVGSSPLQLPLTVPLRFLTVTFSILGRIEPTATLAALEAAEAAGGSFSILGRIEPTATLRRAFARRPIRFIFQYPRSDRAHCNVEV